MPKFVRTLSRAFMLPTVVGCALAMAVPSAGAADPTITVSQNLTATTHIKKTDQTVKISHGTFTATIDLVNGNLKGNIKLPPGKVTFSEAGLPLATATMVVAPVKPTTGHIDFRTFYVTAKSVFNIRITKASPALAPSVNLVGDQCTTSTPVTVVMSGKANLKGSSTFKGTYTIPSFKTCGALTPVLTQLISGPGNTFSATATPK